MKKIALLIILIALSGSMLRAQEGTSAGYKPQSYYTFSWNNTFPMGDFHDWTSRASMAGFDIGGRFLLMKGLMTGFNVSWQRVSQKYEDQTWTIPEKGIAITAENYRFTWMVPFQGVIGWQFIPEKMISPYVSLGIGGDYMEHHLLIQEYDIYKERWDFSLTPEVGALVKFGPYGQWGALVAFNYKWTTNNIEIYESKSQNLQMLNLKVGLAFIVR